MYEHHVTGSERVNHGIVLVGGGLAAARTAEQLRRSEYTGRITIVSDEVHLPYDRPPLSKEVLRKEVDDVALKPREWYDEKAQRFRIVVDVHNKTWGRLFGYRGSFDMEWRKVDAGTVPGHILPYRQERRE